VSVRKSQFFSNRRKLATEKDRISAKFDSRSLEINLRFDVSQINHSFKHEISK